MGRYVDGTADRFWVYQDGLNPIAQFDGAGNLQMVFVYGLRGNVPELIVMQSGQVLRVIADQVGSVRRIVDVSDGTVWQDIQYSPFGVIETETMRAGFDQPFRFAGGIWDADTRLIRFGARDYDVLTGRWTAKDPIRFDGGVNLYEYANGAPQMYVDPTGLEPWWVGPAKILAQFINVWLLEEPLEGILQPDLPFGPTFQEHHTRNRSNRCPGREPPTSTCEEPGRSGYFHWPSGKWRWNDGSECAYDEKGDYVPGAPSFNFGAEPLTPYHVWQDVVPHFGYGGLSNYESPDPTAW